MYGESPSMLDMVLPVAFWPLLVAIPLWLLARLWQPRLFPFVVALAMAVAVAGLHGAWQPWPRQALDWLFWASILPALAWLLRPGVPAQVLAWLVAMVAVGWPLWQRHPSMLVGLAIATVLVLLVQSAWRYLATQPGHEMGLLGAQVLLVLTNVLGGSVLAGQLSGALLAVSGVLWLLPLAWREAPHLAEPVSRISLTLLMLLAAYTYWYVDVPWLQVLVALVLPLLGAWLLRKHWLAAGLSWLASLCLMLWWLWPEGPMY
ncbi:hypothetical protein [Balneatrix alpica]|uniref:hypothetical protein n=1 Tax=Balneatrix alpica TaxID=75684 RepID=UPI0027387C4C|nr:hypothetical protein [Balneatrix alpica]